jgi:hypothetical protein
MVRLELTAELAKATAYLSTLAKTRVPHAAARALTSTAFDARDAVRARLPERFTIRRPWVPRGIGVTPATPRALTALVWSRDRFMALQESGGVKTGKLSIPVGPMAALARSRVIPKSQWPGRLLRKRNVFYRAGMVFERRGERAITPLYLLRKRQRVAPRFGMAETVRSVALQAFGARIKRALLRELNG